MANPQFDPIIAGLDLALEGLEPSKVGVNVGFELQQELLERGLLLPGLGGTTYRGFAVNTGATIGARDFQIGRPHA
jgi:hypothetical protein